MFFKTHSLFDQLSTASPSLRLRRTADYRDRAAASVNPVRRARLRRTVRSSPSTTNVAPEKTEDYALPPVLPSTETHQGVLDAEPLVNAAFDQTVYVGKDHVGQEAVTSALYHAEVVPETPVLSLVRKKRPFDRRQQMRKTLIEVVAITLPALGTLMADPLMSLVDTACVGQISAVQLAALGPNTAIFNMIATVFSCMAAAMANRMACNSTKLPGLTTSEKQHRQEQNEVFLCHSSILAIGIGLALTVIFSTMGRSVLLLMGTTPDIMRAAGEYLFVRGLAAPAALFMTVAQGACLGQQDMWIPMKIVLAAGLVNLLGDVVLIIFLGLGTAGAATATALSQVAGALFFVHYLRKGGKDGTLVRLKWKGLPSSASLKPILDMARVLLPRSLVLMIAYTAMTTVATTMGTLTVAAHQVVLQAFWFMATLADSVSMTAQSLLARDHMDKRKARVLSGILMKVAAFTGLALCGVLGGALGFIPRCFASDVAVIAAFQSVIPHSLLSLFVYSLAIAFEGICIGANQLEHLPRTITKATVLTMASLWWVREMQLGLNGVWSAALVFFVSRALFHAAHVAKNWKLTPFGAREPSLGWDLQFATV